MRLRGFMWGNAQYVKLNGAQTGRLRNLSVAKIPDLEFRRYWALCVAELHPDMPATMRPVVPDNFFFRKYRRTFVLELDLERDVWVLNVLGVDEAGPGAPGAGNGDAAPGGGEGGGGGNAAAAAIAESVRHVIATTSERVSSLLYKTWAKLPSIGLKPSTFADAKCSMARWLNSVKTALSAHPFVARLHHVVSFARGVSEFFTRVTEFEAQASYRHARLEQRRVDIAPGLSVIVNTFIAERTQWEDWLFGRLVEEEQLAG